MRVPLRTLLVLSNTSGYDTVILSCLFVSLVSLYVFGPFLLLCPVYYVIFYARRTTPTSGHDIWVDTVINRLRDTTVEG